MVAQTNAADYICLMRGAFLGTAPYIYSMPPPLLSGKVRPGTALESYRKHKRKAVTNTATVVLGVGETRFTTKEAAQMTEFSLMCIAWMLSQIGCEVSYFNRILTYRKRGGRDGWRLHTKATFEEMRANGFSHMLTRKVMRIITVYNLK